MRMILLLAVASSFLLSCGGSTEMPRVQEGDPSNLEVEITVSEDGSGLVTFDAKAVDAILYEFEFGTSDNDTGSSDTGDVEYVYENTGVYTVQIKAYGSSGRFIRKEEVVSVNSGTPATTGEGYTTPISYEGMNLVWGDEFDSQVLNQSIWNFDNGNGCPNLCGWGNNELEYYRPENHSMGNGVLTIEARKETFQSNEYTSTKIHTKDKKSFKYGRVDVRAKLPRGKGIWPAIWLLGHNISSVGWPSCGEIDIMEMVGGNGGEKVSYGTAHWSSSDNNHASNGGDRSSSAGLDNQFHVYSIIWDESKIQWLLNDVPYHNLSITNSDMSEFHNPFYMILNVAVGGNWPGNPDSSTEFPTQMQIDYVRVFQ